MPSILVTNDDGIGSQGLKILSKTLRSAGDVYVVAPETEQSAVGHALTLHRPLRFEKINNKNYSINGTPTDCVILAVNKLLPRKPDIIISGINNGGNMGDDVTYSGTVAAAIEGTFLGIPSIAISLIKEPPDNGGLNKKNPGLQQAARFALTLAGMVMRRGLPPDTLLNVNVPNIYKIKGIKFTHQGRRIYDNAIQEMLDPRKRKHYWIGGGTPIWRSGEHTDFEAVQNGFISITPIHLDLTNYDALRYMKKKWRI
ncbi:MAG: 5'/3'-nucleotidase SurE [Nitrospirae bacterium]|nr:5'/3'-nucleotidase SurE [Nitrospirota bacterium]